MKKKLDENIGGVVGIGAITQITHTPTIYEDAFERFLAEKYDGEEPMKENIGETNRIGILDDIDNDLMNMDIEDKTEYLETIIRYCQSQL